MKSLRCLSFALALATFGSDPTIALAQDAIVGEDWEVIRAPDQSSIVAATGFDNGITLVARCSKNVFDLIITGLPEAPDRDIARQLIFIVDHEADEKPHAWAVGEDRTIAFSRLPALIARQLAAGGNLQIIIPAAPGGRRTRYVMELSQSGSAIEEILSACGRPLIDPRDDQLEGDGDRMPDGVVWERIPQAEFPNSAVNVTSVGYATLSCVVGAQGRPEACQIESEQPASLGFGRSALLATRRARLAQTDEARASGLSFEGTLITFTTEFRLQ